MLDIAFKDFRAKKSRAAMCIIGVMACVLLIGVVDILVIGLQNVIQGDANSLSGELYFEKNKTAGYPPLMSVIDENLVNQILNNSVVNPDKSTGLLMVPLQGSTISGTAIYIAGLTPGKEQAYLNGAKVKGQGSLVGQSDNAVIIGSQVAKHYNVTVGDTFTDDNQQYKVVGVIIQRYSDPTTIDKSIIMSLSHSQNVLNQPKIISAVIITPKNGVTVQDAKNTFQNSYNNTYTLYTRDDALQTLNQAFAGVYAFTYMVMIMVFLVSMVLIMNVMMMTVREKTKEIGTMRAIGTKRRSILKLIMYESLIMSGIGGLIGIILIIPVYYLLSLAMGTTASNISIPTNVLIQIVFVIVVIGTLSGLIPAYLANRISPIEALRYE